MHDSGRSNAQQLKGQCYTDESFSCSELNCGFHWEALIYIDINTSMNCDRNGIDRMAMNDKIFLN